MIVTLASSVVDLSALWKIVAVSILAGAGVVGAFGFVLIGISRYQHSGPSDTSVRIGSIALAALGGVLCVAAIVLGLIAMTHK